MKKISISIIAITIAAIGVMQWNPKTYSQSNLPYPEPVDCEQSTSNEMKLMKEGWNTNLQSLLDQEKPASEMVEEAYEGARTYRCWLNYLCETVLFSGGAPPEDMKGEGGGDIEITREHVDPLPGCLPTGDIEIPGTELRYMPLCYVSKKVVSPVNLIQQNYGSCIEKIGLEASMATVGLEKALKGTSAKQKNRAFNRKMQSLLNKMTKMHNGMVELREKINAFDANLPCYAAKCD